MDRPRLAGGPWLAWLSVELLGRLPGGLIRPPPVDIGRFRYRSGFVVARRSAEDLPPFRAPEQAVRDTALSLNRRSRNLRPARNPNVYASFARMAETGCRSPANRLLLWYFPIARESDPGALVFVPQAAGFKLASLLDLVWRYHPPITWSSRTLRASFKAIWASHLRENLDLGLVAGARNPRDRHLIEVPV